MNYFIYSGFSLIAIRIFGQIFLLIEELNYFNARLETESNLLIGMV